MLNLTRTGLLLTLSADTIPARGSSDVPVLFINDEDTYEGYLIQPLAGWYEKGQKRAVVCEYTNERILIPAAAFQQNGEVMLAVALIDPEDANHIEVTHPITPCVVNAPYDPTELPDADTWQKAVCSLVTQLTEPIKAEAQEAFGTAESALQKADAALRVSGEAKKEVTDKIEELDNMVMNGDFDGASILSGPVDPSNDIGKDGDLYINELTGRWFSKEDGAWADKGSLKGADGSGKVLVGSDVQSAVSETLLLKTQDAIESVDLISLAALLDAAGNAATASDTAIIKHEDQNLKDFINKRIYKAPEGYEITANGIISLRDIDARAIACNGWYYCTNCTGLPINGSGFLEVMMHPTSDLYAAQSFISAGTGAEFKRNKTNGTWSAWVQITGDGASIPNNDEVPAMISGSGWKAFKFPSGALIQTMSTTRTVTITNKYGSLWFGYVPAVADYPVPFVGENPVNFVTLTDNNLISLVTYGQSLINFSNKKSLYAYSQAEQAAPYTILINLASIGRWKA